MLMIYLQIIEIGAKHAFLYCPPNTAQCCSGGTSLEIHLIFHATLHPVIHSFEISVGSEP